MLRISKGKETFALKGDHLETNFQGFYQKSLHWRPRSPMETSVHNPVSIGDQMETTFEVKRRPFGDHFEDNWRPNIKLSVVSRIIGCNIFGLRKMALLFLYLPFCLQFAIFKKYIKPK